MIDLLAFDWMRAQVLQYLLNPLARDGNLRLVHRLAPTHVLNIPAQPEDVAEIEAEQFRHLQSVRVLGYRADRVKRETYHDGMKYGGTDILVDLDADGNIVLVDG